jgi:hypothetical protein
MVPTRDKQHSRKERSEMGVKCQAVPMTKPVPKKNPPVVAAKQNGWALIAFRPHKRSPTRKE